ncbi:MAG: glucuronate isomerase [Candidatus Brocadiia bacterium]
MPTSNELEQRLRDEIMDISAVDVHSHVPAHEPYARSLADLLGYHYYTELAHSAGMDKSVLGRPEEEMIPALLEAMGRIDNTVQYSWMVELARELFGFEHDRLTPENWQPLARAVEEAAEAPGRARDILEQSSIEKVFLTNTFDEQLEGIDTGLFVPSLRADTLVFELHKAEVQGALERISGVTLKGGDSLRDALSAVVEHFWAHGARSAAISLPPGFRAYRVSDGDFNREAERTLSGTGSGDRQVVQSGVLFHLAECCRENALPFQIMYGVVRDAYTHGVPQGTDLPAAGDTLRGLLPLLNAFSEVTFCLSVLSDSQVQELGAYGWIVQNVVLSGHWWYLNVPAHIERDLAARLQSVPKAKLIGYYSDMYKLEFGLAKFNMYRRVLARVLARDLVEPGFATEDEAVSIARLMLRENAMRIFRLEEE